MLAAVVGWVLLAAAGVRAVQALAPLTMLIEQNPAAGESALAQLMQRRALPRWVRQSLYHRLALLRHRQQRWAESAAVTQSLLRQPLRGPAGGGAGEPAADAGRGSVGVE